MPSNVADYISVGDANLDASDVAKVLGKTGNMFGRTAARIRISFQLGEWVSRESLEKKIDTNESTAKKIYLTYLMANAGQVPTKHTDQIQVFKQRAMPTQQGSRKASGTPQTPEERAQYIEDNWMSFITKLSTQPEGRARAKYHGLGWWSHTMIEDQKKITFVDANSSPSKVASLSLDGSMIYDAKHPQGLSIESKEGKKLLKDYDVTICDHIKILLNENPTG